ncbi:MAG TPA: hypothetical protein PK857_05525 [Hyphomicrobium sp.]|nr:hypothetical protein [Hyphomicrobium sp.]HRO50152.1 hypothetical protein [Hyphomicrobium sp.]
MSFSSIGRRKTIHGQRMIAAAVKIAPTAQPPRKPISILTPTLLRNVKQSCTWSYLVRSTPLSYAGLMKKDTSVNVRLTSELRAALQRLADADDRTLSAYIERVLRLHVETLKSNESPRTR